jgi:leader peptidase (prepilin peptidase)/N-methyltransferase
LSYIILLGKCRNCKSRVSVKYPLIELLAGLLAMLAVFYYGYDLAKPLTFGVIIAAFGIWIILVTISFIDMEHMIIPDGLTVTLAVLGAGFAAATFGEIHILERVIGFFAVSVPMLLLALIIKDGFGGGDIKFIAVCGFILGWKLILLAAFIGVFLGGIYGSYIKFIKRRYKAQISFGQYLCIGVFISMLFGDIMIQRYLNLFNI